MTVEFIKTITYIFNARECAILTLSAIAIVIALFFKPFRQLLKDSGQILFSGQIISIYLAMLIYMAGWTYILYLLDLWNMKLLKDTIVWLLFAGTITFFRVQRFSKDSKEYKKTILDIFKGTVLLEFFTDHFPLSYMAELIMIPIVTLLAILSIKTEKDEKLKPVDKLLRGILMILGFLFLGHILYKIITGYHELLTIESLQELLLAPIFSILLLPFIYVLSYYMTYESQMIVLNNKIKSPELLKYAKRKILFAFQLNQKWLIRWQNRIKFDHIYNKKEIDQSIRDFKALQQIEKTPPTVSEATGWSPYSAMKYLGPPFETGFYDPLADETWIATSKYFYLGNVLQGNYIHYDILGSQTTANSLELIMTIMFPADSKGSNEKFITIASILYKNAINSVLPHKLQQAIQKHKPLKYLDGETIIAFNKEVWQQSQNKSYAMVLTIQRGSKVKY